MKEWETFMERLKEEPPEISYMLCVPKEQVAQALSAWEMSQPKFVEPKEDFPQLYDDRFWWLWNACSFNVVLWARHLGFNPPHGFFVRLINGRLIFPDGTYNTKFYLTALMEETRGKK